MFSVIKAELTDLYAWDLSSSSIYFYLTVSNSQRLLSPGFCLSRWLFPRCTYFRFREKIKIWLLIYTVLLERHKNWTLIKNRTFRFSKDVNELWWSISEVKQLPVCSWTVCLCAVGGQSGTLSSFCSSWLLLSSLFPPLFSPHSPTSLVSTWGWLSIRLSGGEWGGGGDRWRWRWRPRCCWHCLCVRLYVSIYTVVNLYMEDDCRWRRRGHVCQSWSVCSSEQYRWYDTNRFRSTYRSRERGGSLCTVHHQHLQNKQGQQRSKDFIGPHGESQVCQQVSRGYSRTR